MGNNKFADQFAVAKAESAPPSVMTEAISNRETSELQSMMIIAKNFPRNEKKVIDQILTDCQRPSLAEKALYSYARGGTDITGPSIHLAKAIARRWGNMLSGLRELEQRNGESTCEAFSLDLESNYKEFKVFQVPHIRHTRNGSYRIEDPRDIYELVANNGSRRERACILSTIPGDVIDAAVNQCVETMRTTADTSPGNIKKMLDTFMKEFNVTKEQIEKRLQRRIEAITPAQFVGLRNIYNSLKDGMSQPAEWFEIIPVETGEDDKNDKTGNAKVADALGVKPEPKNDKANAGDTPESKTGDLL